MIKKPIMKKRVFKKLLFSGEILFGLVLALVIIVSVFPLVPPFRDYYHSRTVLTGSMEPKISKGSVVIDQWTPDRKLKIGDVVTYQHLSGQQIVYITHRIVKVDKSGLLWRFETKGDANPVPDFDLITQTSIEGKVVITFPLIGYLVEFFKTPAGFILFIALPLLIFIVQETRSVWQIWKGREIPLAPVMQPAEDDKHVTKHQRRKPAKGLSKKNVRKVLATVLITLSFLAGRSGFVTYASFTSGQAAVTGVTLSTAASFDPSAHSGDVVINEIMWMGSAGNPSDEWIELRNTTGGQINLIGWKIDNAGSGSSSISLSGTVPANGYFLLSHYATNASAVSDSITADQVAVGLSLVNTGEQLTFKDGTNHVIDQTPAGSWPAGINGPSDWKSMERNGTPGDGTLAGNWHTCNDTACHSTAYWDTDGHNWGTPKAANLSGNDPTSVMNPSLNDPTPPPATLSGAPASPSAQLTLRADQKHVSFTLDHIGAFKSLTYQLSYDTSTVPQGILGSADITGDSHSSGDILLGTCSTGGTCVYNQGVKNFRLSVSLKDQSGAATVITTSL